MDTKGWEYNMKIQKLFIGMMTISLCASPIMIHGAVEPGATFEASASCGVYEGTVQVSVSNATVQSADNWCERGKSVTAKVVAGSEGTASVSFIVVDGSDTSNDTPVAVENVNIGGTSVNVKKPTTSNTGNESSGNSSNTSDDSSTKTSTPTQEPEEDTRSKDATLKSLSITGASLSPKFSAETTSYKVELSAEITSVEVKATVNDSKASVTGTGEVKVQAGENEINVVVTSEYGTKQTYTITAYVDETPFIYTEYAGAKLGVVRNINGVKVPDGFKITTVTLDENEISAWVNENISKTIVYLSDEDDNRAFYLFEEGKISTKITYTELLGRKFFIVDIPEEQQNITGMTYGDVTIEDTELKGWTFNDKAFENYVLIYVMGMDGEMYYYQYEQTENILQLYSGAASVTQESYQEQVDSLHNVKKERTIWMYVAIGSWIVIGCAIIGFIIWRKRI